MCEVSKGECTVHTYGLRLVCVRECTLQYAS